MAINSNKKDHYTISDIAKRAGVGIGTVSRVLNKSGFVSEATRLKVMAVVEELNYVPNSMAQNLGRSAQKMIGIITGNLQNQYFTEILAGIEETLRGTDYLPLICPVLSEDRESFFISELIKNRAAGVIFTSSVIHNESMVNSLLKTVKTVSIQTDLPDIPRTDCENESGTKLIVNKLIEKGHRKIAYIDSFGEIKVLKDRLKGYYSALEEKGISCDERLVFHSDARTNYIELLKRILGTYMRPTAIHCCNDAIATEIYKACMKLGLNIPNDISVTGFDNLPSSELLVPRLTTVQQPLKEMGMSAAKDLIRLIETDEPVEDRIFPVDYVDGKSVKSMMDSKSNYSMIFR